MNQEQEVHVVLPKQLNKILFEASETCKTREQVWDLADEIAEQAIPSGSTIAYLGPEFPEHYNIEQEVRIATVLEGGCTIGIGTDWGHSSSDWWIRAQDWETGEKIGMGIEKVILLE